MQQILTFLLSLIRALMSGGPAVGGALELAQKAADTTRAVKDAMADLHPDKKAQEMADNREYAGHIVRLAAMEAGYNTARGFLQVAIYAIMTWGVCRLAQALIEIAVRPTRKNG